MGVMPDVLHPKLHRMLLKISYGVVNIELGLLIYYVHTQAVAEVIADNFIPSSTILSGKYIRYISCVHLF